MLIDKYLTLTGEDPIESHDITEEVQLQAMRNIAKLQSMKKEKFKNWDWKREISPRFNT